MTQQHRPGSGTTVLHDAARRERDQLKQELFVALARANKLEQELTEQRAELHQVYSSSSWRLTRPLREASLLVRRLARPRHYIGRVLASITTRFPRLRGLLIAQLNRFPALRERLRSRYMPSLFSDWNEDGVDYTRYVTLDRLPPSARSIYETLSAETGDGDSA
jgi:hypothetical protein